MTHDSLKIDANIELKVLKISWITEELKKLSKKAKKVLKSFPKTGQQKMKGKIQGF